MDEFQMAPAAPRTELVRLAPFTVLLLLVLDLGVFHLSGGCVQAHPPTPSLIHNDGVAKRKLPPRMGVKAKFWLTLGPRTLFGEGKADLLEAVDRLGSLHRAASSMGMSYRYAWGLLRELDEAAGFAFLEHSGAGPRTNLHLSEHGRRFLQNYRKFRAPLDAMTEQAFRRVFRPR